MIDTTMPIWLPLAAGFCPACRAPRRNLRAVLGGLCGPCYRLQNPDHDLKGTRGPKRSVATTHRLTKVLKNMKSRCTAPANNRFKSYGGKGITVCAEWSARGGAVAFITWAEANGYEPSLTIDRINPAGNYEPSNCRWITREENTRKAASKAVMTPNGWFSSATTAAVYHGLDVSFAAAKTRKRQGGWYYANGALPPL